MPECANCGTIYGDDKEKCPECGSKEERIEMERKIKCPECGHLNPRRRSTCENPNCGASL